MKKLLMALWLGLSLGGVAVAADLKEGVEYKSIEPLETDSGDKIEVLEFFWYGCPHCSTFEPFITKWKQNMPENVEFTRVPTVFHPSWKVHARAYYALDSMGQLEKVHQPIFDAIHKDRAKLTTMQQLADFVTRHGVDKDEFIKNYQSFSVDTRVRKANKLVKDYNVTGVPFVAVNGKYITDGKLARSYDKLIEVIDHLVAKESR